MNFSELKKQVRQIENKKIRLSERADSLQSEIKNKTGQQVKTVKQIEKLLKQKQTELEQIRAESEELKKQIEKQIADIETKLKSI